MIEITYDATLSALNDAVVKFGHDFSYEKGAFEVDDTWEGPVVKNLCAYMHSDAEGNLTVPGCIVGHAMLTLGVPKEFLAQHNTGPTAGDLSRYLEAEGVAEVTGKARTLLGWVQGLQDDGTPWGAAVVDGVEHVNAFSWNDKEQMVGIKATR